MGGLKSEIRNPKPEGNPQSEVRKRGRRTAPPWRFGIRSGVGFRHSEFGFHLSVPFGCAERSTVENVHHRVGGDGDDRAEHHGSHADGHVEIENAADGARQGCLKLRFPELLRTVGVKMRTAGSRPGGGDSGKPFR
jgi:hypothetical protein